MAQNLGYIKTELERVRRAAADTEAQMRALERSVKDVIIAGSKGSGASSLTPEGVGVSNVAKRALKHSNLSISGSPVGGRAIVGSGVDEAKIREIATEYNKLAPALAQQNIQIDLLTAAERKMVIATERATEKLNFEASLREDMAKAEAKIAKARKEAADEDAQAREEAKSASGASVKATREDTAATEEVTKQRKIAGKTLGASTEATEDVIQSAADVAKARKDAAAALGEDAPYTQERLEAIFAKQPGTAKEVSRVAGLADFKPEDIKADGITEYAGAFTQLRYEVTNAEGVMRKMILTTDRAGNVFTSTQKQFRTFFGAIRRNVTEMLKWSAATLVVWGAIRKLGELLEIAIENETQLASIAVILGEEHANLTTVFNSAAEAAAATGESIDGVLEGYVQAYRATGNIADQSERAEQAQALLTDALTLSKLSALSTAQAMDVLTGALRQAGLDFDEGTVLLDKWVAVSRAANVGIETLAESFAITATSASNAGLEWDELNGVIATLAESTTLSATESGNAIRAFISGFNTDTAVKELTKYGIAVTDSTGETRGFLDVMKEIASLFSEGIITESELNKISRAIGGGARREAQVATTIKNLSRAQEVAAVSARADGDAQAALAVQLDTVQTAITKLNNSFQKLARSMGSEGGVLDAASSVLDIFTKLVDMTSSLVKNIGDMTPVLAAMGGLFAATTAQSRGLFGVNIAAGAGGLIDRISGAKELATDVTSLGGLAPDGFGTGFAGGGAAGTTGRSTLGARFAKRLGQPGFGRNAGTLLGQSLGVGYAGYQSAKDLSEGDVAGAASSAVGAIIGGLLSGGSPVGFVIGSAAGEAFANATFNYKADFTRFFSDVFVDADPEKAAEITDEAAASREVFRGFGAGNEAIGNLKAVVGSALGNFAINAANVIGNVTGGVSFQRPGYDPYTFQREGATAQMTPEQFARGFTPGTEASQRVGLLEQRYEALEGFGAEPTPDGVDRVAVSEQKQLLDEWEDVIAELKEKESEAARDSALRFETTSKDLADKLDNIPALGSILTKYEVAFGDELRKVDVDINTVTESFEYWTNLVLNGSTEQKQKYNEVAEAIAGINNAIEEAARQGDPNRILLFPDDPETEDDEARYERLDEAEARIVRLQQDAITESQLQEHEILKQQIKLPTTLLLDIDEKDLDKVLTEAERLLDESWAALWEATDIYDQFDEEQLESVLEPMLLRAGQSGGAAWAEGFTSEAIKGAVEGLIESGEIEEVKPPKRRGLQQLDISSGELGALEGRYNWVKGLAESAGYVPDEETFAAILNDYVAMPITADLTLLNIAMQELIDVSKDQLDGIYNLPTDSTFYVPFAGYGEGFVNQGGGVASPFGGEPGDGLFDGEPTEEIAEAVAKVVKPDRWRIEQDARIQNFKDREAAAAAEGERTDPTYAEFSVKQRNLERAEYGVGEMEDPFTVVRVPDFLPSGPELSDALQERGPFQDIVDNFKSYLELQGTPEAREFIPGAESAAGVLTDITDFLKGLFGMGDEADPTITTKLQIESTTNTIVQLDGQVIANAIKPYLLNDEVRYEGTAGAAVKRFVI